MNELFWCAFLVAQIAYFAYTVDLKLRDRQRDTQRLRDEQKPRRNRL